MTTKNQKLKMALTSTPMILIYVMVVFCLIAAIRQPAFLSPATAINLARAGIFTMCFAIVKWWSLFPAASTYLSPRWAALPCMCRCT